jgi:hypothetical protein
MATHPALADLGIAPRLLTREQAAAYCGVGLTTFTAWVRRGIVPGSVPRTHRSEKPLMLPSTPRAVLMLSLRVKPWTSGKQNATRVMLIGIHRVNMS